MSVYKIPSPTQPDPLSGYWSPENADQLLAWDYVNQRMIDSRNYWIATINPNGKPHTVPVWGVWIDNTLYIGGGSGTRWFRNLEHNPSICIHLDNSDHAVILEGQTVLIDDPDVDEALVKRIQDAYEEKYDLRHPLPLWRLLLHKVIAWTAMDTATRWQFVNATEI